MNYEYRFFHPGSTERIAATVSTTEPLPCIQVGHSLILNFDDYSEKCGYHLEIRHEQVYLYGPAQNCSPSRVRIFVYSVEEDGKAVQENLNG